MLLQNITFFYNKKRVNVNSAFFLQ